MDTTVAKKTSGTSKPPHKKVKTGAFKTGVSSEPQEAKPPEETIFPQPSRAELHLSSDTILPPELAHLQTKYEIVTMSIISSSKMEQKIKSLLSHLARFNYADIHCKPGVVALHAKAPVASKMTSIVEKAKKVIEDEKGQWWQYSRCHGELAEWKQKATRAAKSTGISTDTGKETTDPQTLSSRLSNRDGMDMDVVEGVEEEEVAFQTMSPNKVTAHAEARKKVRAVPRMTIYMARVPILEFKAIYGY